MNWQVIKEAFKYNSESQDNPYRVLGSISGIGFALFLGYFTNNMIMSGLMAIGLMTFVYYQNLQPGDLFRRMGFIGLAMLGAHFLGLMIPHVPGSEPIIIAFVATLARFIFRLRKNPIPGSMFIIMITTISSRISVDVEMLPQVSTFFSLGVLLAIIIAMLVQRTERGPSPHSPTHGRSLKELFYEDPASLIDALVFGGILFILVYLSHLFRLENNTWIIVSAVAILQMSTSRGMMVRQIQRILGTFIGIGLAAIYLAFDINLLTTIFLILICYTGLEVLIRRNYLYAMIFIQPMVIMLLSLAPFSRYESILISRFLGVFFGSILGFIGGHLMNIAFEFYRRTLNIEDKRP